MAQRAALDAATADRDELNRRQLERVARHAEERELREHGPRVSLSWVRNGPLRAELEGVIRLDPSAFTRDDRKQLDGLRRVNGRGELTDSKQDMRTLERLVDKAAEAAGHGPGLIARRRRELAAEAKRTQEAERLHTATLPARRAPEPGSVELPRLLWRWVTDGRHDTFSLNDLGLLAGLLFAFANDSAALFARSHARIGRDDTGPVITLRDAAAGVRLGTGVNPSGGLDVRHGLETLHRNRWVTTERNGGTLRIRPGERMRDLYPGGQL